MPDPLLDHPRWAPTWLPRLDDERSVAWLRRVIGAVLVAGLLAFVTRGADGPPDPFVEPAAPTEEAPGG